jgi:hypothetical protein
LKKEGIGSDTAILITHDIDEMKGKEGGSKG